jgi:hypothetical protein
MTVYMQHFCVNLSMPEPDSNEKALLMHHFKTPPNWVEDGDDEDTDDNN